MKRANGSIGKHSIVGFMVALGATAAAPGCAPDQPGDATTSSQAALDDNNSARLEAQCPPSLPAALNPPADATLAAVLPARGVQIYNCAVPAAGGAPAWTLKAPHAVLGKDKDVQAIHFAGPSWQALDGSIVTGARVASSPAPDGTSIAWLLLQASGHTGAGSFANVTWIQRLDTENGAAPATGCDDAHVGAQVLSAYAADYFLYRPATDGERLQQCAAR